jgi:hypothetical protein
VLNLAAGARMVGSIASILLAVIPAAGASDLAAIPWGSSEAEVRGHVRADACVAGRAPAERVCAATLSIGEEPVRAYFWLLRDRLVQVNLVVASRAFDRLAQDVETVLGVAALVRFERVTRGAVSFTNEIRDWRGSDVSAVACRYELAYGGDSQASIWIGAPTPPIGLPGGLQGWGAVRAP